MVNPVSRSLRGAGREFMQGTEYGSLPPSDQMLGRPSPPLEAPYTKTKAIVSLPAPERIALPALDLRDAIERRESIGDCVPQPLTLPEIAFLLWCTQGVRRVVDGAFTLRTVPSAGARHAFETYLLVKPGRGCSPPALPLSGTGALSCRREPTDAGGHIPLPVKDMRVTVPALLPGTVTEITAPCSRLTNR